MNGFDAVAEENARGVDHVMGDTSTRDVVEDGIDESKNLDIDEGKKIVQLNSLKLKKLLHL